MSIDFSEFYQTFFDEASEHLEEMENLLLGINVDSPDLDDLNAIFRAAHSIKGGSGMFDFTEMTEVTHILETLLDKLRKGELRLTDKMIDAFLQTQDILKSQIESRRLNNAPIDHRLVEDICAILTQLTEGEEVLETIPPPPKHEPSTESSPAKAESVPSATQQGHGATGGEVYEITFWRHGSPLADPAPFDWLIDSLAALGQLEILDAGETAGKPAIVKIDHPRSIDDIKEAFAFFVQPEQVEIVQVSNSQTIAAPSIALRCTEPSGSEASKPEQAKNQSEEEAGWGLFSEDDAPETAASEPPHAADDAGAEKKPAPVENTHVASPPASPLSSVSNPQADRPAGQKSAAGGDSSIRVNIEKVDQLINLVGELVITQAMLEQTTSEIDPVQHEKVINSISLLQRNTRDLQEAIMSIRMMPMSFVFNRFPRMVRDIAGKLKKEVNFKTYGEGTELDKGLIEKIIDPMTHLVRNSLDHGIESPEVRVRNGKDPKGSLILRAFHQGGNVVIEVRDDGGGLNRAKILAKARERGIPVSDTMTDQEVWLLIFAPGFSTADAVTDVSGRGVGMDVVKKNIESLGGRVEIESYAGVGTTITIRLPLTLAILDGLSIAVGEETFIIPLTSIIESLQPSAEDIKTVARQGQVVHVRGEYLPLVALYQVLQIPSRIRRPEEGTLMIVEADGVKAALLVDELLGQHQVVIKSLETNYRKVPGISGATIMGDGRVALIIDITGLVRMSKNLKACLPDAGVEENVPKGNRELPALA